MRGGTLPAQKAFAGDRAILEIPLGFFHVLSGAGNLQAEEVIDRLGKPFEVKAPGLILRKHPAAPSHPAVDAASEVAAHPDFDLSKVGRIGAHVHHLADQVLIRMRPKTELEAKFSLGGCLAPAPVYNKLSILSFTDPSIGRAYIQVITGRIELRVIPARTAGLSGNSRPRPS